MPAIRIDCTQPQPQQLAKLGWFEQMQMQLQLPKQDSMFRQQPTAMGADTWSDPSLPNLFKSFSNIMPRGDFNETVADTTSNNDSLSEAQGRVIRVRDFDANENESLSVDGMTVLPITISVFVVAVLLIVFVSLFNCYRRRQKAKRVMIESENNSLASSSRSSLKSSGSSFDDMKDMKPIHPSVLDKYTTAPTKITDLRQLQQLQRESQKQAPTMRQWTPGNSPIMPPVKPWTNGVPIKNKRSPKQSSPYPLVKDSDLPAIPPDVLTSPTSGAPIAYYSSPRIGRKGRTSTKR